MSIDDLYRKLLPFAGQSLAIPGTVFPVSGNIARFCVALLDGRALTVDVDANGVVLSADQQAVTLSGKTGSYEFGTFDITMTFTQVLGQYSAQIAIDFAGQSLSLPGISWLALTDPGFALTVGDSSVPATGAISGNVLVNGETIGLSMALPISNNAWSFKVTFDPPLTIGEVLQFIGGINIATSLQPPFSTIAASVGVTQVDFVCSLSPAARLSTQVSIGTPGGWTGWTLAPGVSVTSALLDLSIDADNSVGYAINSSLTVAGIDISLSALYPVSGQGWTFLGQTGEDERISLTGLLSSLCSAWQVSLPSAFPEISFKNLSFSFATLDSAFHFGGELDIDSSGKFSIAGNDFAIAFTIAVDYANSGYQGSLTAILPVGAAVFGLEYDFSKTDSKLSGYWKETGSETLGFADIARKFGSSALVGLLDKIPSDLDLALENASFSYDFTAHTLLLEAQSANYGSAVFVSLPVNGTQQYFFLLGVDKTFSLSDLPLIGHDLASIENIQVGSLQVIIGSATVDQATAVAINALISASGTGLPAMPTAGTTGDLVLSAQIDFGDEVMPLMLSMGGSGGTKSAGKQSVHATAIPSVAAPMAAEGSGAAVASSGSPDGTTWYTVQKSFGPVTIQRVGAKYQSSQQLLWFEIDASLALGPMTLTLVGLGLGSSISDFSPKFELQGMGISYSKPPLSIAGTFVNLDPPNGVEFEGSVAVGAESFQFQAFGFYGDQTGVPSMFIFGDLAQSFGGPPAFFVTGVALGFGYNSALRLPTIDQVANFPFIEILPNSNPPNTLSPPTTPQDALTQIMTTVPPWVTEQAGSLWFAAGLTFTSFELVNSQALVIVEDGADLTISLIGTSQAQFPQAVGGPVYAYIGLDLLVVFKPEDGIFSLEAVLSKASFLLDRACTLTGGFAFYVWFGSDPHSGDFVLTLGGYNPGFVPPSYYPVVPALGFNWSLDSSITISGHAYFAFTPSVLMVGGELSAVYQSGDLKAWFDAHADIIVHWKPFWFDADIGITVGASYYVDLWLTSFTVRVELGCDLHLWGPPTGGTVSVDWYIISFTIPFGSSRNSVGNALTWSDVQAMLPNTGSSTAPNVLSMTPTTGISPSATKPDPGAPSSAWLVRGSQFGFATSTPIPATTLTVGNTHTFHGSTFNVAPLGWSGVSSTHKVTITDTSSMSVDWSSAFSATHIQQNLPASLWGSPSGSTPSGNNQLVPNLVSGVSLQVNPPQIGSTAGAVNVELYLEGAPLNLSGATLPINSAAQPSGDVAVNSPTTIGVIADPGHGIGSTGAIAARNAIFAALQALAYAPDSANDPMGRFAQDVGCAFNAEPLLVA